MAATEPSPPWTVEQLGGEEISKKQIVEFLQAHSSSDFLKEHKLNGKVPNIVKATSKPDLIAAYKALFETKAFRDEAEEARKQLEAQTLSATTATPANAGKQETAPADAVKEEPRFKKSVLKAGDKKTFPKKGDKVTVRYKGMLENGTVFDQNMEPVKKKLPPALTVKVGVGNLIRGWDEGILTMSVGEKAKLTIESEWAYGKKGMPDAGIPPNSPLIFEVVLEAVD